MTTSWVGASVTGEAHRRLGEPNQDAWAGREGSFGSVVVVADGMGSRAAAKRSAEAACQAVLTSVRLAGSNPPTPSALLRLVDAVWLVILADVPPADLGSTCLLSWQRPDGSILLAQVGDGLCCFDGAGMHVSTDFTSDGWLNETESIGSGRWKYEEVRPASPGSVLLATDGVAADLREELIPELVQAVAGRLRPLSRTQAWRELASDLRAWPAPGSGDDRTMVVHLL